MSTSNFMDMLYDMPMVCGKTYEQMVADYDGEFTEDDYYFESQMDFENAVMLAEEFAENLKYHNVTVEPGYYEGFQFYVTEKCVDSFDLNIESEYCIDNEYAHYYFDVCKSVALREADREKRKITRWLYSLADNGYNIVVCTARYSNGAAEYSIVDDRARLLAAVR